MPWTRARLFEELLDEIREAVFNDELPTSARLRRAQALVGEPEYDPELSDYEDDDDDGDDD